MEGAMRGYDFYNWYDKEVDSCIRVWWVSDGDGQCSEYVFADTIEDAAEIWDDDNNPHGLEVIGRPWRNGPPTKLEYIWQITLINGELKYVHEDETNRFVGPFESLDDAIMALKNYRP
jgi:hypothetical protein